MQRIPEGHSNSRVENKLKRHALRKRRNRQTIVHNIENLHQHTVQNEKFEFKNSVLMKL